MLIVIFYFLFTNSFIFIFIHLRLHLLLFCVQHFLHFLYARKYIYTIYSNSICINYNLLSDSLSSFSVVSDPSYDGYTKTNFYTMHHKLTF